MKKLTLSFLLGSSLLFSVNQSYGAEKVIDRFHPWFDYIKNLVKKIYEIDITKAKFPEVPPNQKFQSTIKGDGQNWELCYRILKYDNLDAIEKTVFDKLQLDKKDFVHILGFNGTYFSNGSNWPRPGYFFQGLFTHYLTWSPGSNDRYYLIGLNGYYTNGKGVHFNSDDMTFYMDWNKSTQH